MIRIEANRVENFLQVVVSDTGVGIARAVETPEGQSTEYFGIGLRNVSSRMEQLYKDSSLLRINSSPGEGTTVSLRYPLSSDDGQMATLNGKSV